ncbi:MAG: metallophosphoesterase family protein [Oscillospiraceae bacterium]|nr:metallophosphoesterase family protein [Oscillospiraceae bacterium]
MKIAVLSDIHGNHLAFKRCIEYALKQNIKDFIFLGDYVGELAFPQNTMEILYNLKESFNCNFIKGNKENYWLEYNGSGWNYQDSTTGSLLYTYNNLTKKDISFFKSLDYKAEVCVDNIPPITICHGSPYDVSEKMLPYNERTNEIIYKDKNSIILCGHTHIQREIICGERVVYNPGSVGLPLNSNGKTQFMILEWADNRWKTEFISLDYDVEKVISELYKAELNIKAPYWCIVSENMLRYGKISHAQVLNRAMQICKIKNKVCEYPNIPEDCWEKAVEEIILE